MGQFKPYFEVKTSSEPFGAIIPKGTLVLNTSDKKQYLANSKILASGSITTSIGQLESITGGAEPHNFFVAEFAEMNANVIINNNLEGNAPVNAGRYFILGKTMTLYGKFYVKFLSPNWYNINIKLPYPFTDINYDGINNYLISGFGLYNMSMSRLPSFGFYINGVLRHCLVLSGDYSGEGWFSYRADLHLNTLP